MKGRKGQKEQKVQKGQKEQKEQTKQKERKGQKFTEIGQGHPAGLAQPQEVERRYSVPDAARPQRLHTVHVQQGR
jgi:hypothetical protein